MPRYTVTNAIRRVQIEFKDVLQGDETDLNKMELIDEDWRHLKGVIAGPLNTPYEGGKFILDIEIPDPFNPPKVRCVTKVWHPNISSVTVTGEICLDILGKEWLTSMNMRTLMLSIQALLSTPEPDDPQDAFVASQYKDNHTIFETTAKHWTNVYAEGPHKFVEMDAKIQRLKDRDIEEHDARVVLSKQNWDLEKATDYLFS